MMWKAFLSQTHVQCPDLLGRLGKVLLLQFSISLAMRKCSSTASWHIQILSLKESIRRRRLWLEFLIGQSGEAVTRNV